MYFYYKCRYTSVKLQNVSFVKKLKRIDLAKDYNWNVDNPKQNTREKRYQKPENMH